MVEEEGEFKTLDEILDRIEVSNDVDEIVVEIKGVSEAQLEKVKKVLQLLIDMQ